SDALGIDPAVATTWTARFASPRVVLRSWAHRLLALAAGHLASSADAGAGAPGRFSVWVDLAQVVERPIRGLRYGRQFERGRRGETGSGKIPRSGNGCGRSQSLLVHSVRRRAGDCYGEPGGASANRPAWYGHRRGSRSSDRLGAAVAHPPDRAL